MAGPGVEIMESEDSNQQSNTGQNQKVHVREVAEKIKRLAVNGSFIEAERLREKLLEDYPMELSHIVASGEIIEQEKTKQLNSDHLAAWASLYENLSSEEINCLYYSLKQVQVEPGKLLTAQGKANNRLFFIDSGRVSVFYRKDDKNKPVIQLSRGDLLGEETFFGIALCPLSAATVSAVELRYLSRREAESWQEKQPGLYEKVADYCRRYGKSDFAVQQKNSGRRKYQRYTANAVATAHILDRQGKKTSTYFKGALTDISRSGTSFSIKCSRQETARALLARAVDVAIDFNGHADSPFLQSGVIVKVSFHLHNDYTVHVSFSEIIGRRDFTALPCDWSAAENQ